MNQRVEGHHNKGSKPKVLRQQYHFRQSEGTLYAWDIFRIIELARNLPVNDVALADIKELDEEFWFEIGGAKPTCRSIAQHAALMVVVLILVPMQGA